MFTSARTPTTELPRDQWKRPLITPPEGGEPVAYRRVTTFAGALDDTYHLNKWKARMVARGMAVSRDLQMGAASANPDDRSGKRTLDEIAEKALERANGTAAATTGTALHSLTEKIDRNEPLGFVPEEYLPDLAAYRNLIVGNGISVLAIEGFCVLDAYKIGGTYDRILDLHGRFPAPDGTSPQVVIGDVKTGGIDFAAGKIAMQLAAYSRSLNYDHRDGSRSPLAPVPGSPTAHYNVSQEWGVVIHLPAGTGTASLHWIDLTAGAVGLELAARILDYRDGTRRLLTRFAMESVTMARPPSLTEQIHAATSADAIRFLYRDNAAVWTPGLTSLAKQRVAELEGKS